MAKKGEGGERARNSEISDEETELHVILAAVVETVSGSFCKNQP